MMFYSTSARDLRSPLKEAVIRGLAPDGGLYMPETITPMPKEWFQSLGRLSLQQIARDVSRQVLGDDIPQQQLYDIVDEAINFEVKLVEVEKGIWAVELFHGPTLAFKDFGARFLAGLMQHYASGEEREIIVLAATSGDTGSAVANGFLGKKGVRVIILYPSGKVSPLQEKQLTTLGGNIVAWEIDGTFDDCQRIVKQAFLDKDLTSQMLLTSANSISIGRLLPQTFYYFYAWSRIGANDRIVFSVPSGNFGNLTAGVIATRLGLPVKHFVAATNINDVVPEYLERASFNPRPSTPTISNAMDVGNPSNFARLLDLYRNDHKAMAGKITGYSFTDDETRMAVGNIYKTSGYLMDPHGAVGYLGLKEYQREASDFSAGAFLATAHPAKFDSVVNSIVGGELALPPTLQALKSKEKRSVKMSSRFEDAKTELLKK